MEIHRKGAFDLAPCHGDNVLVCTGQGVGAEDLNVDPATGQLFDALGPAVDHICDGMGRRQLKVGPAPT